MYLYHVMKSHYCQFVFLIIFIASGFLVPKSTFHGILLAVSLLFMITFAVTITCIVRNIKEKVKLAKSYRGSIIGIISTAVGLSALQVCGASAPVCAATIGMGVLSAIMPGFVIVFFVKYNTIILVLSIIAQLIALYTMRCFIKINCTK